MSVTRTTIRYRCSQILHTLFTGKLAIVSNTVSGLLLFIVGDSLQQKIEIRGGLHKEINLDRIGRMATVGFLEGPPHHLYYKYVDHFLPGKSLSIICKKILLDQFIACPFFSLQFFIGMSWLEGKFLRDCWKEFATKFPTVYMVDWLVWPPIQFINFLLIPSRYRVLYVNGATVVWNVFLSYMKHYDQFSKEVTKEFNIDNLDLENLADVTKSREL